jgi:Uma2 family endonuclease
VSMPAVSFDDERFVDPDDVKMPERPVHRQAVDLVALAATQLLGSESRVFRDMNWYPADGGGAVAPDVMVLPADAVEAWPRSYRQDRTGGPPARVAVEVPSDTDTFVSLRAKARRYQRLGTVTYVVTVDDGELDVLRLGIEDREFAPWAGQPIPELGGLRLDFDDGDLVATLPDGTTGRSDSDLVEQVREAEETARRKIEALTAQLEALGVEPADPDPA